jgi:hypothetical protein
MKTTTLITSLCCILIAVTSAVGQEDRATARPEAPQQRGAGGETRILQHLLQMDDQELVNLRQTIERIEKMPPEEKEKLRERIGKIDKMPPEQVDAMRKKYESIPNEQREAMRERWMGMSAEERTQWREKLRNMSHEERAAVFEEQGFMAPRPKHDKKGPRKNRPGSKGPQSERGPTPDLELENEEN